MGSEMLRGVYTERSECAQHDSGAVPDCRTAAQVDAYYRRFISPNGFPAIHTHMHSETLGPLQLLRNGPNVLDRLYR